MHRIALSTLLSVSCQLCSTSFGDEVAAEFLAECLETQSGQPVLELHSVIESALSAREQPHDVSALFSQLKFDLASEQQSGFSDEVLNRWSLILGSHSIGLRNTLRLKLLPEQFQIQMKLSQRVKTVSGAELRALLCVIQDWRLRLSTCEAVHTIGCSDENSMATRLCALQCAMLQSYRVEAMVENLLPYAIANVSKEYSIPRQRAFNTIILVIGGMMLNSEKIQAALSSMQIRENSYFPYDCFCEGGFNQKVYTNLITAGLSDSGHLVSGEASLPDVYIGRVSMLRMLNTLPISLCVRLIEQMEIEKLRCADWETYEFILLIKACRRVKEKLPSESVSGLTRYFRSQLTLRKRKSFELSVVQKLWEGASTSELEDLLRQGREDSTVESWEVANGVVTCAFDGYYLKMSKDEIDVLSSYSIDETRRVFQRVARLSGHADVKIEHNVPASSPVPLGHCGHWLGATYGLSTASSILDSQLRMDDRLLVLEMPRRLVSRTHGFIFPPGWEIMGIAQTPKSGWGL